MKKGGICILTSELKLIFCYPHYVWSRSQDSKHFKSYCYGCVESKYKCTVIYFTTDSGGGAWFKSHSTTFLVAPSTSPHSPQEQSIEEEEEEAMEQVMAEVLEDDWLDDRAIKIDSDEEYL